jgi:hypothetical protein
MLLDLFRFMTIFLIVLILACSIDAYSANDTKNSDVISCTNTFVEELWTLKPVGESQLFKNLVPIHNKYGKTLHYPTKLELFRILYHSDTSPYDNLDHVKNDVLKGKYESYAQVNAKMIQDFVLKHQGRNPRFAIEVGSFVGSGALHVWGPLAKASNDSMVLCVDTWEGDINMRLSPDFQKFMNLRHGFPSLYKMFIDRVKINGMDNVIFPLPLASLTAGRLLSVLNWVVDVVYIDSAHEIGETFAELFIYFQLVRPGGILMGDDYTNFPAVKHDVDLFVKYKGDSLKFHFLGNSQWAILKI